MRYVVGLGSSEMNARDRIRDAVDEMARHPLLHVLALSRDYESPAAGGATTTRFVNAAAVVESALAPAAFLRALHAIEHRAGRVRAQKNAARTLDLDVLLALDAPVALALPAVPHPRFLARPFAVVPAVEALERAHCAVPFALREAQRASALSPLSPL